MLSVMTRGLQFDLNEHYLQSNTQKAINLANQIERFVETRRIQLEGQSNSPIVKQAAMQPESSKGLLVDFLGGQTVVGRQYPQQVFDFKGDMIFDSGDFNIEHRSLLAPLSSTYADGKSGYDRFESVYKKRQPFGIQLSPNRSFWEIILPIKYGDSIEGVFVTYIPVLEMVSALNLTKTLDVRIKASTSNGASVAWGSLVDEPWQAVSVKDSGVKLAYSIDMSSVTDSFKSARNRLLTSALLVAILAIGFALFIGRWFFVRPLQKLQVLASELSDGTAPDLVQTKWMTVEIQELSDRIADMAKQISLREKSLIEANETLKQNQDTLVHAEKMAGLGQVTAGVAHEINNPIGFIMNNLTMLQEYHEFLKRLVTELMVLKESIPEALMADLTLQLSAIEETLKIEDLEYVLEDLEGLTGESIEGAERVKGITLALKGYSYSGENSAFTDINECINSTLKMVWNELKYTCTVHKNFAEIPQIECMGSQINQVFMNLFVNAAHAMEAGDGELTITTNADEEYVIVTVTDNGCGIPRDNLKHIFEPFFTTKEVGQGTGLGMSICYDIIKKHQGKILVESVVGIGTTFTIVLPFERKPEDSQNAKVL